MKKTIIASIILFTGFFNMLAAQHIFPEQYEGCISNRFAMERDSMKVHIDSEDFIERLRTYLGEGLIKKIEGELRLQVIVDVDGNSCLLSLENGTNVKSKKINLKPWCDNEVKWEGYTEKVAAIILLQFSNASIQYRRIGIDAQKGWHYLN